MVRRRQGFYAALRDELTTFAERSFSLSIIGEDGKTHRERIDGMLKRARKPSRIAELEAEIALPPFPQALDYLWSAFNRIRGRKGSGMAGPLPIEWPDIDAFCRLSRMRLDPWEIEIIEALDDLYLSAKETDLE